MGKLKVEDCAKVCANAVTTTPGPAIFGQVDDTVTLTVTWPSGDQQTVRAKTVSTKQRLGGVRRWFLCPRCSKRVGCLYSPSPDQGFACRSCWNLSYESQAERPNTLRSKLRLLQRLARRKPARKYRPTTKRELALLAEVTSPEIAQAVAEAEKALLAEENDGRHSEE